MRVASEEKWKQMIKVFNKRASLLYEWNHACISIKHITMETCSPNPLIENEQVEKMRKGEHGSRDSEYETEIEIKQEDKTDKDQDQVKPKAKCSIRQTWKINENAYDLSGIA